MEDREEKPEEVVTAEEQSEAGLGEKPGTADAETAAPGTVVWELLEDTVFGPPVRLVKIVAPPLKVEAVGLEMMLAVEEKVRADGDAGPGLSVAEGMDGEIAGLAESLLVMKTVEFSSRVVGTRPDVAGGEEGWMGLDVGNGPRSSVAWGASDEPAAAW